MAYAVPIADPASDSTSNEPFKKTSFEHCPDTAVPMPAPKTSEAITEIKSSARAARLTLDRSQIICRSTFLSSKKSIAEEAETKI
jgi:hypothetical protein